MSECLRGSSLVRLTATLFLFMGGCTGGSPPGGAPKPSAESPEASQAAPSPEEARPTPEVETSFTVVTDSIQEDGAVEALVTTFRGRMREEIQEVIGFAAVPLSKDAPEGTLGNFAADAMLRAARRHASGAVHMAMTNNGGLRVPVAPGPITVGQMFELMPFENMLCILTLSGEQVVELSNQIAAMRGEPIAGFSFRVEKEEGVWVAREIRVGGESLDSQARYRLVTNDYLANGGGNLTPLHNPLAREDLPVLLRDALIDYVRAMGVIDVELEGRISGGIEP